MATVEIYARQRTSGSWTPIIRLDNDGHIHILNHLVKKTERGAIGAGKRVAREMGYTVE